MRSQPGLRGLMLGVLALVAMAGCSVPGDPIDPQQDQPGQVTLTIDLQGSGAGTVVSDPPGIDCGDECTAVFPVDTALTLTATPRPGSVFGGWFGACTNAGPTCDLTISGDSAITATFSAGNEGDGNTPPGNDDVPGNDIPGNDIPGVPGDDTPGGDDQTSDDQTGDDVPGDVDPSDDFGPYGEQVAEQSGVRDGTFHYGFGATVAMSGDYAIVGSPGEEGLSAGGGVFIFERDGRQWVEAAHSNEIFTAEPGSGEGFGFAVAATLEHAVVGTDSGFGDDDSVGAAYFFRNSASN